MLASANVSLVDRVGLAVDRRSEFKCPLNKMISLRKLNVRLASSRSPTVSSAITTAAQHADAARLQYIPFFIGTIRIIRKVFSTNHLVALSKLRESLSDETINSTIVSHFELVGLLNRGGARAITGRYPHYANKYIHAYLMRRFTKRNRREVLACHHRFMAEHVAEAFYEKILEVPSILWSQAIKGDCYTVSLSFDPDNHSEGDVSLTFNMNNIPIYEVSFTVVPGRLIRSLDEYVVLVARVQGKKNQAEEIGIATRACERIAPPHLLVAAVESIAVALGIKTIGGVTNDEHLVKSQEMPLQKVSFNYDAFWESLNFKRRDAGTYELELSFVKSLDGVANYREGARFKRRKFKERLREGVQAEFVKSFLRERLPSISIENRQ